MNGMMMTSRSNIILGYKGKMVVDDSYAFAPYVPLYGGKMKIEIRYERGHPEGYTDDLGIIADRNQWVRERLGGWYTWIHHSQIIEVYDWCDANLQGYWKLAAGVNKRELYISEEKDVTLFSLKWS
jgi:hypothetical protein